MPSEVSQLVDGSTYPASIRVRSDGEPLHEANETDLTVSILNRIEFIRQQIPTLQASTPTFAELSEEFLSFGLVGIPGQELLLSGNAWQFRHTNGFITAAGAQTKNPGGVQISAPTTGNKVALFLGAVSTSPVYIAQEIDRWDAVVQAPSSQGETDSSEFIVGIGQGIDDGVQAHGLVFSWDNAANNNWRVVSTTSGGTNTIDTGVPVVANQVYTLEAFRDAATGDWSFRVNGSTVGVFPVTQVPTTETVNFGVFMENIGSSAIMIIRRLGMLQSQLTPRFT